MKWLLTNTLRRRYTMPLNIYSLPFSTLLFVQEVDLHRLPQGTILLCGFLIRFHQWGTYLETRKKRMISEHLFSYCFPIRLVWADQVPWLKIAASMKVVPSPKLSHSFRPTSRRKVIFTSLQFCTLLYGLPTPSHTFVKLFTNYLNLSMPSVSFEPLTNTYAKHLGLSIWFVWWRFFYGL